MHHYHIKCTSLGWEWATVLNMHTHSPLVWTGFELVSVSAALGKDCWREDYRFLQCCVFLDVTSQRLSIRAGNIESLPKSVTTNGSSDLAGVGVWTDAERETHGHTLYTSTANQARKKMITKVSKTYTECIFMHINWHIHTFHKDIAVFLILISSCCVCIWM